MGFGSITSHAVPSHNAGRTTGFPWLDDLLLGASAPKTRVSTSSSDDLLDEFSSVAAMDGIAVEPQKQQRRRHHASSKLPDDCLRRLFEFAPLSSLLNALLVSTPWRENALDDKRWHPVLPPPALRGADQWAPSTRVRRASYARYYARYVRVLGGWAAALDGDEGAILTARGRVSALDGWFALAPWARRGMRGGRHAQAGDRRADWLRRAVFLPEAARANDQLRRSSRHPPRSRDQGRCAFFNEACDDSDDEGPLPLPVLPLRLGDGAALADALEWESRPPLSRTSVTVAYAHGNADPDPQHWGNVDQILWGCATIGAQFLSAYFGPCATISLARQSVAGLSVGAEAPLTSLELEDEPPDDSIRVVVSGCRLVDGAGRAKICSALSQRTQVLSFLDLGPGFELAARGACAIILHAALRAAGLPLCAHTRCALNPIDSAGDLSSASLLCCPVCFRRLELRGVPAHNTIQAVARVSKRWRDSSTWDLGVLARWGYVEAAEAAVDPTIL